MKPKQSKTKTRPKAGRTASLRCDAVVSLLLEAQAAIENLPMGGIGRDGATQAEIDEAEEAGHAIEDDASHHQGQKAWLILERAKVLLANKNDDTKTERGQSPLHHAR